MPADTRRLERILAIDFNLQVATGLRIGGSDSSIAIGGAENVIIRNPLNRQPYIPGSSLKGKMRSLVERTSADTDSYFNQKIDHVWIHACKDQESYEGCLVCQLFGVPAPPAKERWFCQTRLRVHDLFLSPVSAKELIERAATELPYTEVKSEVAIDRVTAQALPRTIERVPAGAVFGPGRLSVFLYNGDSVAELLGLVTRGLELLEYDYLGGGGARGSGRVQFEVLSVAQVSFPVTGPSEHATFPGEVRSFATLRGQSGAIADWSNAG
jgi:CRISPR-associated protein Csm3